MYQSSRQFDCGRCCVPPAIDGSSIESSMAVIWKERNFKRLQMQVEITVTDFWTLECVKSGRVLNNFNKFTLTKVLFTILFHLPGWNQWFLDRVIDKLMYLQLMLSHHKHFRNNRLMRVQSHESLLTCIKCCEGWWLKMQNEY